MKVGHREVYGPPPMTLTIHRGGPGKDFIFTAKAVLDYSQFDIMVPEPKPPLLTKVDGGQSLVFDDPGYMKRMREYAQMRTYYMIITSLSATEGLEWDRVKMSEPHTWAFYEEEFKSWLTPAEMNDLFDIVNEANNPTQRRQKEATDAFIRSQVDQLKPQEGSQPDGQQGT